MGKSSFLADLFKAPKAPTLSEQFEQLIIEMNVKVLTAIFQGKNKALAEVAEEINPEWRKGVCLGMVLNYIGSHHRGEEVQEHCRANMKGQKFFEFGVIQDELNHQKRRIELEHEVAVNKINEEIEALQTKVSVTAASERMATNDFLSSSISRSSITRRPSPAEVERDVKVQELANRTADTVRELADLEARYVYNSRNRDVLDMRAEVFSEVPLANVATRLESGLNEPGFYYLKIRGSGTDSHAIGFAVGGGSGQVKPRMLDPNSCEFEFTDR